MRTITLNIKGRVPSKKNSKQIISIKGRPMIISSSDYTKWERGACFEFSSQAERFDTKLPIVQCSVSIDIIFPDLRCSDLSNKAESLLDALVRAGILQDDNWRVVNRLELVAIGADKDHAGATIRINIP